MEKIERVILDRDGLIVDESQRRRVYDSSQIILLDGVEEAFQILKEKGVKVCLATKQRIVGSGHLSHKTLGIIHEVLQKKIRFQFEGIYVETERPTKEELYLEILSNYSTPPENTLYVDNDPVQCEVAKKYRFQVVCSKNLLYTIQKWKNRF